MISILSKLLERSALIFERSLALIIWFIIGPLVISLLPGFVVAIKKFVKPFLMSFPLDFLGANNFNAFSCFKRQKPFIGLMLGTFGTGFYLLFGFSSFMQLRYSNAQIINPVAIVNKASNKNINLIP